MKVLGIGESVIDIAHNVTNDETTTHIGGPSAIALILLSRLGIDCTLMTTLGNDAHGAYIEQTVKKENIVLLAQRQEKTKVNTYTIAANGSRKKTRGGVIHNHIENIDKDFLQQFDVIIIDRHEKKAFYEILAKKKSTTKIIIDPSTEISNFTLDMIKYADYPIIPIEALTKVCDEKDLFSCLQELQTISNKTIIITAGELGSIIYDGQKLELIPTVHIQAVDVQGAGDVYRGGFAYGILQGMDLRACADFANKVAALQCTRLGNSTAIPNRREIDLLHTTTAQKKRTTLPTVHKYFLGLNQL